MKIATKTAWATEDGKKLVDDGDPSAAVLVSGRGQLKHASHVERFENAGDYFEDVNPAPKQEAPARKRVEDQADEPKGKDKK